MRSISSGCGPLPVGLLFTTVVPMVLVFLLAQRWFVQGFSRSGLR